MTHRHLLGGILAFALVALFSRPASSADCGCLPTDGGTSIYYDCSSPVPAACQGGGGSSSGGSGTGYRTPGLLDKLLGTGGAGQNAWQNTLNQENAGAAADNARIAAEHAAFLQRQAAQREQQQAAPPPRAVPPPPPPPPQVSQQEKDDTLSQMRGLGGDAEAKKAQGDGLQLRGFDKSIQPSRKELKTAKALPRLCADCLGAYTTEVRPCDANENLLGRNECINRAAGIWKKCVAAVDCPVELRTKIPTASDFSGTWYLCADASDTKCENEFGTIAKVDGRWRFRDGQYTADSSKWRLMFMSRRTAKGYEDISFHISLDGRRINGSAHTVTTGESICGPGQSMQEGECVQDKDFTLIKKP